MEDFPTDVYFGFAERYQFFRYILDQGQMERQKWSVLKWRMSNIRTVERQGSKGRNGKRERQTN